LSGFGDVVLLALYNDLMGTRKYTP